MKSKRAPGFTLMELLVAMAIFGTVSLALASALHSGVRAWKKADGMAALHQEARTAMGRLGRELRNAIPVGKGSLTGTKDEVTFYTLREDQIFQVAYKLSASDTPGSPLVLKYVQSNASEPGSPETTHDLTSIPTEIKFEYAYSPAVVGGAPQWKEKWTAKDEFPAGVRLHITLRDPKQQNEAASFLKTVSLPMGELRPWQE